MRDFDEATIAHMNMIQGIVTRLETNCFTLKALAMTLAAALLAFAGSVEKPSWIYALAGSLPVVVFWIMDARYLRLGRLFRHLFTAVRKGDASEPFTMDISSYTKTEQSVLRIAFSWSILWYYAAILVAFLIVGVVFIYQGG